MRFEKWQALGNDYIIAEAQDLPWPLTAARVRRLCAAHTGVGADGVLLLDRADDPLLVAGLRIFNPDGSEAELSGNGVREAVMYLRRAGWTDADEVAIHTAAGLVRAVITGPMTCRVDMGTASLTSPDYPQGGADGLGRLNAGGRTWAFQHVSVGNPQCAIAVVDIAELTLLEVAALGPAIERHTLFPRRTNVSWFTPLGDGAIRARIFERGVGETMSSGTGACGAAIAHVRRDGTSPVRVQLDGGELEVEVDADLHVTLTGWALPVYRGELSEDLVKELDETE